MVFYLIASYFVLWIFGLVWKDNGQCRDWILVVIEMTDVIRAIEVLKVKLIQREEGRVITKYRYIQIK